MTPLLIVPLVLIVAQRWLTPEQVSLGVIAFASLGHHLPGFMRAYGDRDLFRRFRMRFLLVPVMLFGVALIFSPPSIVASAFGLPWKHLHGLELILLIWGTWHGLMQTYGFMRIYDVRQGVNDRLTARLDHWLCLSVFVAGVAFSEARVFGVANAMWQCGLPTFGREWVDGIRIAVGAAGLTVLVAYLINQVRLYRQGVAQSWVKLLLIGTTGWFYWYTGRLSTNVLIGIAMFEIYHAVQYYAIVWIYNRRLLKRAGDRFGPLGFLFQDRWTMLGIYLAAIAAYSSIRLFSVDANEHVFSGGSEDAHQWLIALFVTSSFLHFYFDGFIWKVSEKKTQENLVDELTHNSLAQRYVPAFLHASKWGVLLAVIIGLLATEYWHSGYIIDRDTQRMQALMQLTPELPECQSMLCQAALQSGDPSAALEHGHKAVALRPRSHSAHADLSLAYVLSGQMPAAQQQINYAIELAPNQWEHHVDRGHIADLLKQENIAEQAYLRAIALAPHQQRPREQLAEFYLRHNRDADAARAFEQIAARFPKSLSGEIGQVLLLSQAGDHQAAVELASFLALSHPNNWRVLLVLGAAYNVSGEPNLALKTLAKALQSRPQSAEIRYQLGYAYMSLNQPRMAIGLLKRATEKNPQDSRSQLLLANAYYATGDFDQALVVYQLCTQLEAQDSMLYSNMGGIYALRGQAAAAEQAYRTGLTDFKDSAQLNYNLGVLLWKQGKTEEARERILRAEALGMKLSAEVRSALKAEK